MHNGDYHLREKRAVQEGCGTLNAFAVVSLLCLLIYASLLLAVLRETRAGLRRRFAVYLAIGLVWGLATFLLLVDWLGLTRLWANFMVISGACVMIAYYDFVSAFLRERGSLAAKIGYWMVALVLVPLAASGHIPHSVSVQNGSVSVEYGSFLIFFNVSGFFFFAMSVYRLVREFRDATDHQSRVKIAYLLGGLGLLMAFAIRTSIPPLPIYPVEQVGHLCNALVITYAVTRHRLLDIRLVLRRGLAYSVVVTLFGASVYVLLMLFVRYSLQPRDSSTDLIVVSCLALLMALFFSPMKVLAQKMVDRLFYGETYKYREIVLGFAKSMSDVLDPDELAEAMLKPVVKATGAEQATLLIPENGCFSSEYAERLGEGEKKLPLRLGESSPIVAWLASSVDPLSRETIDTSSEFSKLPTVERKAINDVRLELLVPIATRGRLIAILALSKKTSGSLYSGDDLDLLMTLAGKASVAIENAQLYAQVRERSRVDELTGLSNHRHFQERLDEEISRSSRFGDIFSLIFLDVDSFKTYNDVYGHVRGDNALREIGGAIVKSIRGIDMAFRYGGDEFAVLVPQASLDDARAVAERICSEVESDTDSDGVALTCSAGIASWPTDGVMREEFLQAADAALYHSKRTGRSQITVASEMTLPRAPGIAAAVDGDLSVLSTIYALAATVDAKDTHTYGHSKKVSKYATEIAQALGLPEDRVATIRAAALLHDIGKIGVSDEVLIKTSRLQYDDWDSIRAHPHLGVSILKHVKGLSGCLAGILYHHEQYDGTGYPAGLKGENIPLDARILSIADSYDAMTSFRPYREGNLTPQEALEELGRCAGTQFDPRVVEVFVALKQGEISGMPENEPSTAKTR